MQPESTAKTVPLRPAGEVMRLERMGSFHQTRLSFMRALLRSLKNDRWDFQRRQWDVDADGVGVAVYTASGPERTYSLICYAHDLPDDKRSDRVIAEQWDATFTLFDGIPDAQDIERLRHHVPKQEAGHCNQTELVLARANRSVRLFEHVVDCLSRGTQPDTDFIDSVGYLMRTTAVYGNGKFGVSDRDRINHRPEFSGAFRAELLAVWLIRWFTVDIAEHVARCRGGESAIPMHPSIRRRLGVGNSTGLGMAPFLVLHPALIHSWIHARETALSRVRSLAEANPEARELFSKLVSRMMLGVESWHTDHPRQKTRIESLKQDLLQLTAYVAATKLQGSYPWDALVTWSADNLSMEGQELVVTLVIEPHGEWVDDLADKMTIDEAQYFPIDGGQKIVDLKRFVEHNYRWALELDYTSKTESARFWYYSEEKLEPRVGERYQEPGADQEHPLCYGRDISSAYDALLQAEASGDDQQSVAEFLLRHPDHRHAVRRVQLANRLEYAEIQDNLISESMMPLDLLRCKLSFFGANKFDPRSDRWVRINMYQHAPFPDEITYMDADDWIYPPLG